MEYKLSPSLASQSPAAGFSATCVKRKRQENEGKGHKTERVRERARKRIERAGDRRELEGERLVKWKGAKGDARKEWQWEGGKKRGKWHTGEWGRVLANVKQFGGGASCSADVWWPTDYLDGPSRRYRSQGMTSLPPSEGWSWDFGYWNKIKQFCMGSTAAGAKMHFLKTAWSWRNHIIVGRQGHCASGSGLKAMATRARPWILMCICKFTFQELPCTCATTPVNLHRAAFAGSLIQI